MTINSDDEQPKEQQQQKGDEEVVEEGRRIEAMDDDEDDDEESSASDYLDDEEEDEDDEDDDGETEEQVVRRTYVPNATRQDGDGDDGMDIDDLDCDLSAYVMYHKATTGYPCLSFDVLEDGLGGADSERVNRFPQSAYMVAGTQADKVHLNKLLVLKFSKMNAVKKQSEDSDDDDESDDEEDEDQPDLQSISIPHQGCVNRVRARKIGDRTMAATFSELGVVHLWDLNPTMSAIEDQQTAAKFQKHLEKSPVKPVFSFSGHRVEGYAIDWSPSTDGSIATGDNNGQIFIWKLAEAGWVVDQLPLTGHAESVEDLQWSPNEPNILASCSVDRSIRIWDIRSKQAAAIEVPEAHAGDVNVISWNRMEKAFIVSGGDDAAVKVWDLRNFRRASSGAAIKPVATFKHHQAPITSVEWHPTDGTVFAAASDDNQITLWDLGVEAEGAEAGGGDQNGIEQQQPKTIDDEAVAALPPQLLFMHQGQKEVKELHWHPQLPGVLVSTAISGFDIFRTISV